MDKQIIILAAGKGSRMNSDLPKVMHKVGGIPMLERVIENCFKVTKDLVLVYSYHIEQYLPSFKDRCKLVIQEEQLGTAHAVAVTEKLFNNKANSSVIYGDNPLITSAIINEIFTHLENTNSAVVTLAFNHKQPHQYGRIIVDLQGNFKKIIEAKFANEEEKAITLCNSGIMAFAPGILKKYLPECLKYDPNFPKKELYLTEIIEVCSNAGEKVSYYLSKDHERVIGVNTQVELEKANNIISNK